MAFLFAISLILAFKVLLSNCANHESVYPIDGPFSSEINPNLARWSNWAFNYIANISCEDVFLISLEDCLKFKTTLPQNMNLYYAEPSTEIRYRIALPDSDISKSGSHDGVLVIDPFSKANFGHLVLVFFIDISWTKIQCELNGGIYMGNGECLTLALKNRCHNLINAVSRRRNFAKKCEINFLPLVYYDGQEPPYQNRLQCTEDVDGFGRCPVLRPLNETSSINCDAISTNSYRCYPRSDELVQTRCRPLATCDQAVLISGGWNRLTSPEWYKENINQIYKMLRSNGYHKSGIKIFYANGDSPLNGFDDDVQSVFPSNFKLGMRYHIQKMCQSPGCVDTLFIYLNSPTRAQDGGSLLWDVDGNGIADENEIYSTVEFLFDIRDCKGAEQVVVVADQNYSGELLRILTKFNDNHAYSNVKLYTSGEQHEYSWNSQLTRHWANFHHTNNCVQKVYESSKGTVQLSNPRYFDGSHQTSKLTISGAPCDVNHPLTQRELERKYFGCQTIPTTIWLSKRLNNK